MTEWMTLYLEIVFLTIITVNIYWPLTLCQASFYHFIFTAILQLLLSSCSFKVRMRPRELKWLVQRHTASSGIAKIRPQTVDSQAQTLYPSLVHVPEVQASQDQKAHLPPNFLPHTSCNSTEKEKVSSRGLSWQSTGYDFAFQWRGCGFDPWSGVRSHKPRGQKTNT